MSEFKIVSLSVSSLSPESSFIKKKERQNERGRKRETPRKTLHRIKT